MLSVTRKQIASAIGRLLGLSTSESVLRELRSSIVKARAARANPRPHAPVRANFVDTLTRHNVRNHVLRRVRMAVAQASRTR